MCGSHGLSFALTLIVSTRGGMKRSSLELTWHYLILTFGEGGVVWLFLLLAC